MHHSRYAVRLHIFIVIVVIAIIVLVPLEVSALQIVLTILQPFNQRIVYNSTLAT